MDFFWRRRIGDSIRAGDRAMIAGDWSSAAACYSRVVARQPRHHDIWVQYGHALKELGRTAEAESAYVAAIEIDPDRLDTRLHYARLMGAQGRVDEATTAFADILHRDPHHEAAYAGLVHAGAQHLAPDGFQRFAHQEKLSGIQNNLRETARRVRDWVDISTYPLPNYNAFRHDFPIKAPPKTSPAAARILIEVDARDTAPSFLRSTLLSLIDQADDAWYAVVTTTATLNDHPIASIASVDPRIRFIVDGSKIDLAALPEIRHVLCIAAGTILHPQAVAWFIFAMARIHGSGAWCDHDHAVEHWRSALQYEAPQLWGALDKDLIAQTRSPPAAVLVHRSIAVAHPLSSTANPAERRRSLILTAARAGSVIHIPRILASTLRIAERAARAPKGSSTIRRWSTRPNGAPPFLGPVPGESVTILERPDRPAVGISPVIDPAERIQIIIPTRDAPDFLATAVETLVSKAVHTDRLDLIIVDNRSILPETARLLGRLRSEYGAKVMALDEPFNWSRANNRAAGLSTAENIVFANNDIEMITTGWDDLMLGYLQREDVGAVGTRLLYPDGSIQHAGLLFGLGEGTPVHDGERASMEDRGPQDRFDLTHAACAVTGAFLGMRRTLFDKIGGFDEIGLAVGYNDVDMCLRVREGGLKILYTSAIELIHHESKTRGMNDDRAKIAWDEGELTTLYARWGQAMIDDPGYNPHWAQFRQYDGFRDPTMRQILAHMDRSSQANPWAVTRRSADEDSLD